MTITEKIKSTFESATSLPMIYGTEEDINRALTYGRVPCGVMSVIDTATIKTDGGAIVERPTCVVACVNITQEDADKQENETIINECKLQLYKWVKSLYNNDLLRFVAIDRAQRIYDKYDDIITGYALTLQVQEIDAYTCGGGDRPLWQEKTIEPTTTTIEVTPDDGYLALSKVIVLPGSGGGAVVEPTKTAEPTTEMQTIRPSVGYDALGEVVVNAVTSSIDANITGNNIKQGVTILGVSGNVVEQDATILPRLNDINGTTQDTINGALTETENNSATLATNLTSKGVPASADDGLTALVPKVLDIQSGKIIDGQSEWHTDATQYELGTLVSYIMGSPWNNANSPINYVKKLVDNSGFVVSGINLGYGNYASGATDRLEELRCSWVFAQKGLEYHRALKVCHLLNPALPQIAANTFHYCESLTDLYVHSESVPTLSNINAFYNTGTPMFSIHVKANLLAQYQEATNWATIAGGSFPTIQIIGDL